MRPHGKVHGSMPDIGCMPSGRRMADCMPDIGRMPTIGCMLTSGACLTLGACLAVGACLVVSACLKLDACLLVSAYLILDASASPHCEGNQTVRHFVTSWTKGMAIQKGYGHTENAE